MQCQCVPIVLELLWAAVTGSGMDWQLRTQCNYNEQFTLICRRRCSVNSTTIIAKRFAYRCGNCSCVAFMPISVANPRHQERHHRHHHHRQCRSHYELPINWLFAFVFASLPLGWYLRKAASWLIHLSCEQLLLLLHWLSVPHTRICTYIQYIYIYICKSAQLISAAAQLSAAWRAKFSLFQFSDCNSQVSHFTKANSKLKRKKRWKFELIFRPLALGWLRHELTECFALAVLSKR